MFLHDADPTTNTNIWALPLDGDRRPFLYFGSALEDTWARFSADGRFIAYASRESGVSGFTFRPPPRRAGGPTPQKAAAVLRGDGTARSFILHRTGS
ncbi:MAG: PD40 domain-containing protein [Acidobacteria bacterium]|nr:PD40 domain-containing protein [Acidobacteriota bacterium]